MKVLPLLLLMIYVAACPAAAAEKISNAESFVDVCISGNAVFCTAFMRGFFAGAFSAQSFAMIGVKTCMPDHLSNDVALSVFYEFLKKHPERAKEDFMGVAFSALANAYPCRTVN